MTGTVDTHDLMEKTLKAAAEVLREEPPKTRMARMMIESALIIVDMWRELEERNQ